VKTRLRATVSFRAALFVFGLPAAAVAQQEPVRIEYRAPEGCPRETAFRDALFGRTPRVRSASDGEAARLFRVTVTDGPPLQGELVITDARGEVTTRRITASSCSDVVSALALIAATVIDPNALASPSEKPRETTPPKPTEPAPQAEGPAAQSPPPPSPSTSVVHWDVGAEAIAQGAIGPKVAWGGTAFVELASNADDIFAPSIRMAALYARTPDVDVGAVTTRYSVLGGEVDACPIAVRMVEGFTASPCLGAQAGALRGDTLHIARPDSASRTWIAALGTARFRWRASSALLLEAQAGGTIPLITYTFVLKDPSVDLYNVRAAGLFFGLGAAYRFP
jgi:hypothetical protein